VHELGLTVPRERADADVLVGSPRNQQPGAYAARPNGSKPTSPGRSPGSVVDVYGSATDFCSSPPK